MDQAKLEKMLIMMKELSDNEQYTIQDLARRHHTTTRTIYRYLDTFHEAGFTVVKKSPGVYCLATLGKKIVDLGKLVMFSEEEAFIVSSLISQLDNSNSLKKTLARKLSAVANSTSIADFVVNKSTTRQVEMLNKAISDKRKAVLRGYESGHSETITDRLVEPFQFTTNLAYIMAFEESSGQVKTFKISRIKSVDLTEQPWEYEDRHEVEPQDAFRMSGELKYPVKLELSMEAKNLLVEEFPKAVKDLHKTSTGKWVLNTKVSSMKGIGRFVIGMAGDVRIVSSEELKVYVRECRDKVDRMIGE